MQDKNFLQRDILQDQECGQQFLWDEGSKSRGTCMDDFTDIEPGENTRCTAMDELVLEDGVSD